MIICYVSGCPSLPLVLLLVANNPLHISTLVVVVGMPMCILTGDGVASCCTEKSISTQKNACIPLFIVLVIMYTCYSGRSIREFLIAGNV